MTTTKKVSADFPLAGEVSVRIDSFAGINSINCPELNCTLIDPATNAEIEKRRLAVWVEDYDNLEYDENRVVTNFKLDRNRKWLRDPSGTTKFDDSHLGPIS